MKKILFFIIVLLIFIFSFAEKVSIEKARELDILTPVTVEGYVTLEPGPFANNLIFIEKDGYGVNIYTQGKDISNLNIERNDLIEVTGYTWDHKSNLEIVLDTDNDNHKIKILKKNAKKIMPKEISVKDIEDENLEGSLVKLDAKIIDNRGQEIIIKDETGQGVLWIRENNGINPEYLKTGLDIEITGVLAQYLSKKEIQPRDINDLVVEDIFPPEVQFYSITKNNQVKILFNESIDENIIPGTNVKVLKNEIENISFSFNNRILTVNTKNSLENNRLFLRFIKDKKGNNLSMKVLDLKDRNKIKNNILFDENHGQTSGNADWVLDGAYSDFKDIVDKMSLAVYPLKENLNSNILSLFDSFVIIEPNVKFKEEELNSIKEFINNGGNLFVVADHGGADRNGDGWDAVRILNQILINQGVKLVGDNIEEAPVTNISKNIITENVKEIGIWNGSSIKPLDDSYEVLIRDSNNNPLLVVRNNIIVFSDSSTFDDGTGESGDILHDGINWGDDKILLENIIKYLKIN